MCDHLLNYCPVSNLNFLSKVIEKAVAFQIKLHIWQFDLDNHFRFQSAYKAYHSIKTALCPEELFPCNEKKDFHHILLDRLKEWFGLVGVALDWLVSYLHYIQF